MELLEKHFDIAFSAPDGIKKLKDLVLTLAMQGKLVPQDPSDQPASELMKEIGTEKKRLVKAGEIKPPKPLPEVNPKEVPYELPEGWAWVRLGEICSYIQRGKGPAYADISTHRVISQKCVRWYGLDTEPARFIDPKSLENYEPVRFLRNGDLLWNSTGTGTIGRACLVPETLDQSELVADSHVTVVRPVLIKAEYLWRWIQSPFVQNEIENSASGTTNQIELNTSTVINHLLPLPPFSEQSRIIAKIDQLMSRCDELMKLRSERDQKNFTVNTAALSRLLMATENGDFNTAWRFLIKHFDDLYLVKENVTELRKAILQLAVMGKLMPQNPDDHPASELLMEIEAEKKRLVKAGKIKAQKPLPEISPEDTPYVLPGGWEWVRVCDLVEVGTGSTPATSNRDYYAGNIPWYTSSATNKPIADNPEKFITEKAIKDTNCKIFPSGSLIIALYGQGKTRGQISEIVTPGATNQAIAAMVFYESSKEIKGYLKYFFVKIYEEIRSLAEGAAQPNLNVGKIKEALVPLPPLEEQHRIVTKINQLMAHCDKLEQLIEMRQDLAYSLMNATVADATGVQMIGDVMATKTKEKKYSAGTGGEKYSISDLPKIDLTTKNFTLRKFSMSTGYRSLVELDCLFHGDLKTSTEISPICLVGLNGSGKSNLIEAIADVFCFLELINLPWKKTASDSSKYKKNDHFFELEYDLETNDGIHKIFIKKNKKAGVEFYARNGNEDQIAVSPGIEQLKFLPRRVIGYSSGLNETVSHPFLRTKTLYSEEVRDAAPKLGAPISESKGVIDTRTLYMDYESNAAILICNYIFRSGEELSVINEYTRVNGVSSFNLRFNKKRAGRSGDSSVVRLTSELDDSLKSFLRCAEKESQYDPDREEYELEFNLDNKTASRFRKEFSNAEALFMAMHKWSLLNALVLSDAQRTVFLKEDVTKGTLERPPSVPPKDRIFNISDLKLNLSTPSITIDYSGLSDGEHQFIQVVGTVLLFNQPGSLFLFDEPESHFNPEWRTRFNVILNSLPNAGLHEFMISTHSPFLVSGTRGCNVFKFERKDANVGCKPVDFETYGASFDYLLNKLFGIESMIDQSARAELEEIIRSGNKEAMESALGDFAESREKRRLYQALIEKEEGVK